MEYINFDSYVNLTKFMELQEDIHIGIAEGKRHATFGTWHPQLVDNNIASKPVGFKLLQEAFEEFKKLPEDDPIKIQGLILYNENISMFGFYLKMAIGAYDPYIYYDLLADNQAIYFSSLINWIKTELTIFEHIDKCTLIVCEANGMDWDHKDLNCMQDFIYIRPNTERPMYVLNPITKEKTYINSKVASWDINDWIGHERIVVQTYAIRIEGKFKDGISR